MGGEYTELSAKCGDKEFVLGRWRSRGELLVETMYDCTAVWHRGYVGTSRAQGDNVCKLGYEVVR